MKRLEREDDLLGTVRLCHGCGEEWPADGEFWYLDRQNRVMGRCRACWSERTVIDGRKQAFRPLVAA